MAADGTYEVLRNVKLRKFVFDCSSKEVEKGDCPRWWSRSGGVMVMPRSGNANGSSVESATRTGR